MASYTPRRLRRGITAAVIVAALSFTAAPTTAIAAPASVQGPAVAEPSAHANGGVLQAKDRQLKMSKPKVKGKARVGSVLRVSVRVSEKSSKLNYRWYRDGKKIGGAVKSTYKLKSKDFGHRIKVRVAATKTGFAKNARFSPWQKIQRKSIDDPASIHVVVNKKRPLAKKTYVPKRLVYPKGITNTNGQPIRSVAAKALKKMQSAARKDGIQLSLLSGYRSYSYQRTLYNGFVARDGKRAADLYSARPGYSEHQTGLAIDLGGTGGCGLGTCFGTTAAGKWLAKNAPKYGFILRYPKGKTHITGYAYEPWHFRYVGTKVSKDMKKKKIATLEQYRSLKAAPKY